MRVLLDTHIVLWWLSGHSNLPLRAHTVIADPEIEVLVSAATAWEIAIKSAAGRLDIPDDLSSALEANDFDALPISVAHALGVGRLPLHHADPFDRMLIAQAMIEGLTLISVDPRFRGYDVELLSLD